MLACKICSIKNHEGKHHIVKYNKINKNPPWYNLSRTVGGVVHIRVVSSDDIQEKIECQITELYFHIKIKNMTENDECKIMFVELLSTNLSPASSHPFIAKLSHPVTLHTKSRVGIQNI